MRKFLAIFLLLSFAAQALPAQSKDFYEDGHVFIRTLRGNANVWDLAQNMEIFEGKTAKASNILFDAIDDYFDDSFVSLAFSNNAACTLKNGNMQLSKFKTNVFAVLNTKENEEFRPSQILLLLESGLLKVSRAKPRPTSQFCVSTNWGDFYCLGTDMELSVDENSASVFSRNNNVNYVHPLTKKSLQIQKGIILKLTKSGNDFLLEQSAMDSKDRDLSELDSIEYIWKTTMFQYEGANKECKAVRILPKNLLSRFIKYRRR